MFSSEKRCIFRLYKTCLPSQIIKEFEYGSKEFLFNVCTLCIKSVYAQSHKPRRIPKFSVVNTL